jgi:uncharacterized protein (TIGR02246 family)
MSTRISLSDEAAVRDLFAQFLGGWNQGSGAAFAAPFTEEVTFIGFDGTYFTSRSDVETFHQTLFDKSLKGSRPMGETTSGTLLWLVTDLLRKLFHRG